jgi:CubicO group peptidase (beta-lactamase class C family)
VKHLLVLFAAAAGAWAQPAPLAGFDAYAEKALQDWNVPGVAVAVVKDGKVIHARGYGVRHKSKPDRVTERTVFCIGSLTKAFTAASVGILVDEKKAAWDDPVLKHMPSFQLADAYATREMTLRDLLCHRSGLPEYAGDLLSFFTSASRQDVLRVLRYLKPETSFRGRYAYQNNIFVVAGEAVAAISGKSWDDFVRERIFAPLGMKSSTTSARQFTDAHELATPHSLIAGSPEPIEWGVYDGVAPAASINSTAADMAAWIRMWLSQGRPLLDARSAHEALSPQTPLPLPVPRLGAQPAVPKFAAYGLGWSIAEYQGRVLRTHGGEMPGMFSRITISPEDNFGVVVLSNSELYITSALVNRAVDALIGRAPEDWSAIYLKRRRAYVEEGVKEQAAFAAARARDSKPSLPLASYAGRYKSDYMGDVEISAEGDKLVINLKPAKLTGDAEHWHYDTFRIIWRDPTWPKTWLTFRLDERGAIEDLRMKRAEQFDPSFDFQNYVWVRQQ